MRFKSHVYAFLTLILIFFNPLAQSKDVFPAFSGCRDGLKGHLNFNGKLKVTDQFYRYYKLNAEPTVAVKAQTRFLLGYLNYQTSSSIKIIPLNGENIKILGVKQTSYGRDLIIPPFKDDATLYPFDIFKENNFLKSTKAWEISYEAKIPAVMCDQKKKNIVSVPISVPLDPYLAYWLVPVKERRTISFFGKTENINPCSYGLMTHMVHPSMYWYAWKPENHGENFNCKKLLESGKDYLSLKAEFRPELSVEEPVQFEKLRALDKINISILFGQVAYGDAKVSLVHAKKLLSQYKSLSDITPQSLDPKTQKLIDPSVYVFLTFYKELKKLSNISKETLDFNDDHLIIQIDGKLKLSHKDFSIKFFIGPTGKRNPKHFSFLKDAFTESDLIYYVGHSGMGYDMDFESMKSHLKLSNNELDRILNKKSYQMLGIISCYSTFYYGTQYANIRKKPDHVTDVVLVSIGTFPFKIPLGLISYLDGKLVSRDLHFDGHLAPYLEAGEAVILNRF